MENTLFQGSIISYLVGIPFIILIVLTNRDHRVDVLLLNSNKFLNAEEVMSQTSYLQKLMSWESQSTNASVLIDGFIETHKQMCNLDDCPLNQKFSKGNRFYQSIVKKEDDDVSEKYIQLCHLIYQMYIQGIKKFPHNTDLRLAYAFFLLDKLNYKQQAFEELNQAEMNKPPIDIQFVIYKYKKIIEDEIAESQNDNTTGMDIVNEITFDNQFKQFQTNIERCSLLHMEFWSQLSEDTPDLTKLNELGSKINSSTDQVEQFWIKLRKISFNLPKAMRLYAKFLMEIINDKKEGETLINKF